MAKDASRPNIPDRDIAPVRAALLRFAPPGKPEKSEHELDEAIKKQSILLAGYYEYWGRKPAQLENLKNLIKSAAIFARSLTALDDDILDYLPFAVSFSSDEKFTENFSVIFDSEVNGNVEHLRSALATLAHRVMFIRKCAASSLKDGFFQPRPQGGRGRHNAKRDGISKEQNCVMNCYQLVRECFGTDGISKISSTPPKGKNSKAYFYRLNIAMYKLTFGGEIDPTQIGGNKFEKPIQEVIKHMKKISVSRRAPN